MKTNMTNMETPSHTRMHITEILRYFSPRWFIAIMGTGALANILQVFAGGPEGIWHFGAEILLWLSVFAFPVMLALIGIRLVMDREMVFRELAHSSLVQFYSALFISAAICATGLLKIPTTLAGPETTLFLAKALWIFALVTGSAKAVFTPWRIITLNHGEPKRVLGFWFLPPVGLFVIVFAGNFLALSLGNPGWQAAIFGINTVLLGTALFQTIMLFTIFLFRALTYPFPSPDVMPSFAIGLAPVGVSIITLLSYLPLLEVAGPAGIADLAVLGPVIRFGLVLFWGFGFWWLLVAFFTIATAFRRHRIPVTLGYWAFIFPPAAFALASLLLGQATGLSFIGVIGQVLGYLVMLGWALVFVLTLHGVYTHRIFQLPPSFAEIMPDRNDPLGPVCANRFRTGTDSAKPEL
jgi:tellurite resistance protein TehA-like permease